MNRKKELIQGNNTFYSKNIMATENGTFSYKPTTSGTYTWSFRMKNSGMVAQPASVCYLDNLQVSYPYPYTRIDCEKGQNASYRFGFNGQEKDDEVYGAGNLNTALFWEYDTRIGRRWNLDPKPNVSISPYVAFADNPIFYTDPKGDTTYVYNQYGILKTVILDNLKSNEIVFMRDKAIENMMQYRKTHTENQTATAAREPHNNIGRITSQTVKLLLLMWTKSKAENGGFLYADVVTKEITPTFCGNCGNGNTSKGGELSILEMEIHLGKMTSILGNEISIIGYWHSHPDEPWGSTQPSFKFDNMANKNFKPIAEGGIGLIVNKNSITIYPLSPNIDNRGAASSDNNNKMKMFDKKMPDGGIKTYPSFDKKITPR